MKPDDPSNTIMISEGNAPAHLEASAETFATAELELDVMSSLDSEETSVKTFKYAELAMSTSISMKNLTVVDAYTTNNGGNSDGAMTLTCKVGDTYIDVRTIVLYDESGNLITESAYLNKTIDVKGIVDYFSGAYQIKVFTANDITVH